MRKLDAKPDADPRKLKSIEEALVSISAKRALKNKVKNNDEDVPVHTKCKRQRAPKPVEPEPIPQLQPPTRAKSKGKGVVPAFAKKTTYGNTHWAILRTASRPTNQGEVKGEAGGEGGDTCTHQKHKPICNEAR